MKQRGFTLVELLLALAIFAVMSAMAYSGLTATLKSREAINAALERTRTLQSALFRIRTDLEQSVGRSIRDEFGDVQPPLLGSAQDGLVFTRNGWRNPLQERRSHLQRVGYELDDENQLVRLHWRVLDRAQDSAPVETILVQDIETLEWRYLNTDDEWIDSWPEQDLTGSADAAEPADSADTTLPRAVELRLETKTLGEIRHLFYLVQARQ